MRITKLDLVAYGPFTDRTIEFPGDQYGFHLVYGANEAGKSSCLRALESALFGIDARTEDNFVHSYKNLRIGFTIDADGKSRSFIRIKGTKITLLDANEKVLKESDLLAYLSIKDKQLFRTIYGLDQETLRAGGEEIRQLEGAIGETLFASGGGAARLRTVLSNLDDAALEVLASSAKNTRIKAHLAELKRLNAEIRTSTLKPTEWKACRTLLDGCESQATEAGNRLRELRSSKRSTEDLRRCLPQMVARQRCLETLVEMKDVILLPESWSTDDRKDAVSTLTREKANLLNLEDRLDGPEGLRAQMNAIEVPTKLLENQSRVSQLNEDLGSHLKAQHDCVQRGVESEKALESAQRQYNSTELKLLWADVENLRSKVKQNRQLARLCNRAESILQAPADAAEELKEHAARTAGSVNELAALAEATDTSSLQLAVGEANAVGDLEDRAIAARQQEAKLQVEADTALQTVGLWTGDLGGVATLPLPLKETIDRFETQYSQIEDQRRDHERDLGKLETSIREDEAELRGFESGGVVPEQSDLDAARRLRETGWGLVKQEWKSGEADAAALKEFAGDKTLDAAYEHQVEHADNLSDRLRRESDQVVQAANLRAKIQQSRKAMEDVESAMATSDTDLSQLDSKWQGEWAKSAIESPLSPQEMRSWRLKFEGLKSTVEKHAASKSEAARLTGSCDELKSKLSKALVAVGGVAPEPGQDMSALLRAANTLVDQSNAVAQSRRELEKALGTQDTEKAALESKLTKATQDEGVWRSEWATALSPFQLDPSCTVDQLQDVLNTLGEVFSELDQHLDLKARLAGMEADAVAFESDARTVIEELATDLLEKELAVSVRELNTRVQNATRDGDKLEALQAQSDETQELLRSTKVLIQQNEDVLTELRTQAQCESNEDLATAEQASKERRAQELNLTEIEGRLIESGGGRDIDEIVNSVQDKGGDELAEQVDRLDREIEELELKKSELDRQTGEAKKEYERMDGTALVAGLEEDVTVLQSKLEEDARSYARARIAHAMLSRAIEQYRADAELPVLDRAQEYFSRLTCGRYLGVKQSFDDKENQILVGVLANGDEKQVGAMSDGTRDQLYLALRLAWLKWKIDEGNFQPMPLVLDDILVNFDNERAGATLEVLGEFAKSMQVIMFTHHEHVTELARDQKQPPECIDLN